MGIDLTSSSPELQRVAITCGVDSNSFYVARDLLWATRRIEIVPKEIERICHRGGQERKAEREALVNEFQALPLAQKEAAPPEIGMIPSVVAVEPDGGRYQQRIWDQEAASQQTGAEHDAPLVGAADMPCMDPASDLSAKTAAEAAVDESAAETELNESTPQTDRKGCWREDKNAVLLKLSSVVHESDPAPEIPEGFLDIAAMGKLAREIKNARQPEPGQTFGVLPENEELSEDEPISAAATYAAARPEIVGKQVVATTQNMSGFGAVVAAQAWIMGFFAAERRAFLGDGLRANWTMWRTRFPSFTPILDYIHLMTYIYTASFAGQTREAGILLYQTLIRLAWAGRVDDLIAALQQRLSELPAVIKGDSTSAQSIVFTALRYITNNKGRMNYPEYRRLGLPITTSMIESTVKQINSRVKGTEKFWSEEGADAMLHLRADILSDFDNLDDFFARRETKADGMRSYRPRTPQAA